MPTPPHINEDLRAVLDRPLEQRTREFKYRFAQAVVFGVPVVLLQIWGVKLGGPEWQRWVGLFQALLAGWVIFVGATGMIVECAMLRRLTLDGMVGMAGVALYGMSMVAWIGLLVRGKWPWPMMFAWVVAVVAVWTGVRWAWMSHRG